MPESHLRSQSECGVFPVVALHMSRWFDSSQRHKTIKVCIRHAERGKRLYNHSAANAAAHIYTGVTAEVVLFVLFLVIQKTAAEEERRTWSKEQG